MAGQERFEGFRDEQVLPYRVEGPRPLSRFVFPLPGIDQLIASLVARNKGGAAK